MPRFEFHDKDKPVTPSDLQDLSAVIGNAAYKTIQTDEERVKYRATVWGSGESEEIEGLEEWKVKARTIPLSIILEEVAIIIVDEALRRGAEIRTLSD